MAQPTLNPWVTAPPPAPQAASPGSAPRGEALLRPQPGAVSAPRAGLAWVPLSPSVLAASWWWVGCHGGAGTSTLAAAVPGTGQMRGWPAPQHGQARAVLVARTHAIGLLAAQNAARQWAAAAVPAGVRLLGLVLVADAPGRLPEPLKDLAALVCGGVPRSWMIAYLPALRTGPTPEVLAAAPLRALAADLTRLALDGGRRA